MVIIKLQGLRIFPATWIPSVNITVEKSIFFLKVVHILKGS